MSGCYKHSASKKAVAFFREKTPGGSNLAPLEPRANEGRVLQTIGLSRASDGTEGLWQRIRMEP